MLYYTGIGSRKTPSDILALMAAIAVVLNRRNFVLRSGGAEGADLAFEMGADEDKKEIFIPWKGFNKNNNGIVPFQNDQYELASLIAKHNHPAWDRCSDGAKKLHIRNVAQIFGPDLYDFNNFSKFVVCWTPNGSGSGGTGQAIRIAKKYNIPVFDLGHDNLDQVKQRLWEYIQRF